MAPFPGNMVANGKFYGTPLTIVQRALKRKGYTHVKARGYYGSETRKAIADIQRRAKLPQTGNIGRRVWGLLNSYYLNNADKAAMTNYVRERNATRAAQAAANSPSGKIAKIREAGLVMINNRGQIHYTQSSLRMQGVRKHLHLPNFPIYEDCSSGVTWLYYQAGAPDPNGLFYNGYGFTGSLVAHGQRIALSDAEPGDLVFYGPGPNRSHVACVLAGRGASARCFSHGSEVGPLYVVATYRPVAEVRRYSMS
jgi:cell wall-associated NlpC family hydrolase